MRWRVMIEVEAPTADTAFLQAKYEFEYESGEILVVPLDEPLARSEED